MEGIYSALKVLLTQNAKIGTIPHEHVSAFGLKLGIHMLHNTNPTLSHFSINYNNSTIKRTFATKTNYSCPPINPRLTNNLKTFSDVKLRK